MRRSDPSVESFVLVDLNELDCFCSEWKLSLFCGVSLGHLRLWRRGVAKEPRVQELRCDSRTDRILRLFGKCSLATLSLATLSLAALSSAQLLSCRLSSLSRFSGWSCNVNFVHIYPPYFVIYCLLANALCDVLREVSLQTLGWFTVGFRHVF